MSIQPILHNQTIRIDNHHRGTGQENNWNDTSSDIHLHKELNDKKYSYDIRVPLNQDKEVTIRRKIKDNRGKMELMNKIPKSIQKEIRDFFSTDSRNRRNFFKDVYDELENYKWERTEENENEIVRKISNMFGLTLYRLVTVKNEDFHVAVQFMGITSDYLTEDGGRLEEYEKNIGHPNLREIMKYGRLLGEEGLPLYHVTFNYKQKALYFGQFQHGDMGNLRLSSKLAWQMAIAGNLENILKGGNDGMEMTLRDLSSRILGIGKRTIQSSLSSLKRMYGSTMEED